MIDVNNLPDYIKITSDRCIVRCYPYTNLDKYFDYSPIQSAWIDEYLPYKVDGFDGGNSLFFPDENASQWIVENLKGRWYLVTSPYGHAQFELKDDAALFKLRWC